MRSDLVMFSWEEVVPGPAIGCVGAGAGVGARKRCGRIGHQGKGGGILYKNL